MKKVSLFFILSVFTSRPALAHQPREGDIHASAVSYFHRADPRDHEFTSPWFGAGGLMVEGDIDHNGGLEIAAIFMRQYYSIQQNGLVVDEVGKRMYITIGYRHWFTSRLSSAVSFFSSYSMGDPRVVRNDFGTGPRPATSAKDATDYGFDFSVQYEPVRYKRFSLIADARYSLSVTTKPGESANFYGFLVGLKYFVQSSSKPNPIAINSGY